jgi:hypothetical protein
VTFRLFVSHSSPDQPSQDRLTALVNAIKVASDGAITVLYDRAQIVGGDDWRRRIVYLLHVCDGAIVLLDKTALASDWVLAEATFLSIRQDHDPRFRLVPVSFLSESGLKDGQAERAREQAGKSSWHPVQLRDLQYVQEQSTEDIASQVVQAFRAAGDLVARKSLVEMLADQLEPHLRDAPYNGLCEMAEELDNSVPYLTADVHARGALAIARHMIREASLKLAREQLGRLGKVFLDKHGGEVLESLSPLPFDAEAAALLLLRREDGGYAHAWLQTSSPGHSAPRYVRRAHLPADPGQVLMLVTRHASADSIRAELREEYRRRWTQSAARRNDPSRELSDMDVDERLRAQPMYVCLPPVDGVALSELEQAYPQMAFVMCHDAADQTKPPAGVHKVLPALDPSRESQIMVEYDNAFL